MFLPAFKAAAQQKSPPIARLDVEAKVPVVFNRAVLDLPRLSEVEFALPDGKRRTLVYERQIPAASGNVTWVGHVKDLGRDWRAIVTVGPDTAVGTISTPDGGFKIEPDAGISWVYDIARSGVTRFAQFTDDGLLPPTRGPQRQKMAGEAAAGTGAAGDSVIDVLVLYTDNFAATYPGTALQARIDHLFALANQAYADSQITLTVRQVGARQIGYNANVSLDTVLDQMTKGSPPFESVAALRDSVGADLVSFLVTYNRSVHPNCGYGWIGGTGGTTFNPAYAYSVVADGYDIGGSGYVCGEYTFAHELGHNMGSAHDREHSSVPGAYLYSYGYGFEGFFGTVMSYYQPVQGKFSNPRITCVIPIPATPQSMPCGIEQFYFDSADNAASINNSKATVAAFRTASSPPPAICNRVSVHRFRNTTVLGHYYTTSIQDGEARAAAGEPLVYEGVAMTACANEDNASGLYAVHKFRHVNYPGVYFFSMVAAEVDNVQRNLTNLLTYDGIAFYAYNYLASGTYPVQRFRNVNVPGSNFYTIDPGEKNTILQGIPYFSIEGVGYYAFPPGS